MAKILSMNNFNFLKSPNDLNMILKRQLATKVIAKACNIEVKIKVEVK